MGSNDGWYSHKRAIVASATVVVLAIIGFTIYSFSSSGSPTTVRYDFNSSWKEWDFSGKRDPMVLKNLKNNSLLFVSWDGPAIGNGIIILDSEDIEKDDDIDTDLPTSNIVKFFAKNLVNGRILVIIKNHETGAWNFEWKIFLINPENSHYEVAYIKGNDSELLDILPYQNTFDMVMKYKKEISSKVTVVRYNDQGSVVNKFSTSIPIDGFGRIFVIDPMDASAGYLYITTHPKNANEPILTKLNNEFKEVGSIHLPRGTLHKNACSMSYGKFSSCFFNDIKRKNVTCQIYDSETLKKILETPLKYSENPIKLVTIENLPEGNAMVIYTTDEGDIISQIISSEGKLDSPVTLEKPENSSEIIYIKLIEMKNGSYYLVISSLKATYTKLITSQKIPKK